MTSLPRLEEGRHALFLDFDGTLADIAPRPDAVAVPDALPTVLMRLQARLGGAVALVTGRPLGDIDPLLAPAQLPAAYEHGAVRRTVSAQVIRTPTPDLSRAFVVAQQLAADHPRLLLERKSASFALHYRQAPELQMTCLQALQACVQQQPDLQLLHGKAVIEIKSSAIGKGVAISAFLQEQPFRGKLPVFAGDDVTDESGFEIVQRMGGTGIKVGTGPSCARLRVPDPASLHRWLMDNAGMEKTPS